jgi:hypothetical protein
LAIGALLPTLREFTHESFAFSTGLASVFKKGRLVQFNSIVPTSALTSTAVLFKVFVCRCRTSHVPLIAMDLRERIKTRVACFSLPLSLSLSLSVNSALPVYGLNAKHLGLCECDAATSRADARALFLNQVRARFSCAIDFRFRRGQSVDSHSLIRSHPLTSVNFSLTLCIRIVSIRSTLFVSRLTFNRLLTSRRSLSKSNLTTLSNLRTVSANHSILS